MFPGFWSASARLPSRTETMYRAVHRTIGTISVSAHDHNHNHNHKVSTTMAAGGHMVARWHGAN